jgi:L-lactate utilization protein LutB
VDEIRQWFYKMRVEETLKNLRSHGFDVMKTPDRLSACEEILKRIPANKTVGIGGSLTLREVGVIAKLEEQGNILYNHWEPGLSQDESMRIRKAQQSCDIYLTSANAITLKGHIVNMDGFCNRIASMVFGPHEVIVVAGVNKIVQDLPEAIARIKNIAAPMNAKRFGADTPCAKLGRCTDCDSPHRICRGTLILERKPFATNTLIMIVNETLGY